MHALERLRAAIKRQAPAGIEVSDERRTDYRGEGSAAWSDIKVCGEGVHTVVLYGGDHEALFRRAWNEHTQQLCFVDDDAVRTELTQPTERVYSRAPAPLCAPQLVLDDLPLDDIMGLFQTLFERLPAELNGELRFHGDPPERCPKLYVPDRLLVVREDASFTHMFVTHLAASEVWLLTADRRLRVRRAPEPASTQRITLHIAGDPGFDVDLAGVFDG